MADHDATNTKATEATEATALPGTPGTPGTPAPGGSQPHLTGTTVAATGANAPAPDELGEAGKKALEAERSARKQAEKEAKDAKAALDAIEREKLGETERLKLEAEEGKQAVAQATEKLRRANLLMSLAATGLAGPKALAAARLVDGVTFDDEDQPVNLAERIEAAKATYGPELFSIAPPTPASTPTPFSAGGGFHQGVRSAAPALDEEAQIQAYMSQNFPQLAAPPQRGQ